MDKVENVAALVGIAKGKMPGGSDNGQNISRGFRLTRASEIEVTRPEYVDGQYLEKDTIASVFGDSGSGKTFLAVDRACMIAAQGETVIYIAGEGQRGIPRRLAAWCIEHDRKLEELPLYFGLAPAVMNDEENVGLVIEAIRDVAQANGDPALVVLDTLARNLEGDENSPVDMAAFIRGIERIRAEFHCCVLVVHHSGHMSKERSRGHSSWKAALDTEYRLDIDESRTIRMECTKSKDSIPLAPCAFELKEVPIGLVDEDGRDIFSAVLVPAEYEPKSAPGKTGRGKWQILALKLLVEILERQRSNLEAAGLDPETARVTLDDWRDGCEAAGMPQKRFYETKDSLAAAGLVSTDHGFVSPSTVRSCPVRGVLHTPPDKTGHDRKDPPDKTGQNRTQTGQQTGQPLDTFPDDIPFPGGET